MNFFAFGLLFAGGLFFGMVACLEIGTRIGNKRLAEDPEGARAGLGVMDGAVFSLLGLLVAFTFSGAAGRFDTRRQLIVQEANDIGTAYLRVDLLPADAQPAVRELFRKYLDARLETYRLAADLPAAEKELARSLQLQSDIWAAAIRHCRESGSAPAHMLLLPALNQMFDIVTTRTQATKAHPPTIVFIMLGILSLTSALLAGYGLAGGRFRSSTHIVGFCAVTALTIYVIVDLEYPRLGFIRVDDADRVLIELRQSMK